MIAKPFSPGNAFPAEEVARERITFDKAMIGSCTNGSYDDLLQAALVLRAARDAGRDEGRARRSSIFPGSGGVGRQIERPDPRLGGESIAEVFRSVGGEIRQSWCGPCFGQGPMRSTPGQRAITSFNRNWQNRMGVGGEGYLASPAVVAASALARLHGAAERARAGMGSGDLRRLARNHWLVDADLVDEVSTPPDGLGGPSHLVTRRADSHGDTASIDRTCRSGSRSAR